MYHRLQVSPKTGVRDARGEETQERIQRYLGISTDRVQVRDVYSLFADLTADQAAEIATCCSNPVLQTTESTDVSFDWLIAVGYLPGVTDNVSVRCGASFVMRSADHCARTKKSTPVSNT